MLFRRKNDARHIDLPPLSFCAPSIEGVYEWAQSLPTNNVSQVATEMRNALDEVSNVAFDAKQLDAFFEAVEPLILQATTELERYQPSKIKRVENYQLQQSFFYASGKLFLDVSMDLLNSKRPKHLALLAHAVQFLARSIFVSNKLYCIAPKGSWQALHRSYGLWVMAESNAKNEADLASPAPIYRAIVALNCLSHYEISPSNIEGLYQFLFDANKFVVISSSADKNSSHKFSVTGDTPPIKLNVNAATDQDGENVAYINLSQLLNDNIQHTCPPDIVEQIRNGVRGYVQRSSPRVNLQERFEISTGMLAIHYKVNGNVGLEQFVNDHGHVIENEKNSFEKNLYNNSIDAGDIWSSAYKGSWQEKPSSNNIIEFHAGRCTSADYESKVCQDITCSVAKDCSMAGLCVKGGCPRLANFLPGSLVATSRPDSGAWSLATIRWAKSEKGHRQFGMEYIGHDITPSAVKIVHSKYGTGFLPAFIVADSTKHKGTAQHQPPNDIGNEVPQVRIVIPNPNMQTKFSAIVLADKQETRLILSDCIEETKGYCIYQFVLNPASND